MTVIFAVDNTGRHTGRPLRRVSVILSKAKDPIRVSSCHLDLPHLAVKTYRFLALYMIPTAARPAASPNAHGRLLTASSVFAPAYLL